MNSDELAEIHRLSGAGEPITRIAASMKVSRSTIRRVLSSSLTDDDADGSSPHSASRAARPTDAPGPSAASEDEPDTSHSGPASVIPSYATDFVGRGAELVEIRALLGSHRLVTIAGFGGVGKTRLAARVASEVRRAFPDGVRMIELASVRNPELLPQVVLDALDMPHLDQPERPVIDALADHLRGRQLLIVLDNCEHLPQACADLVGEILRRTSGVRFLTTSREVLDLQGEYVRVLDPLPTRDNVRHGEPTTAMTLFESRARDVLSGFEIGAENYDAVRRVSERLDGLPLAIELACFRLRVLSVGELADRLDEGFALLSTRARSGDERHQSLQAAMAWSHELCTPAQRLLWSRCSIFAGGFDVAMAQAVCADEDLPADSVLDCIYDLVGKSVFMREEVGGRVRFRLLETIREYGHSLLTPGARDDLQLKHLAWCHGMITDSVNNWFGPDQIHVAEGLRVNLPNLRGAIQTVLGQPGTPLAGSGAHLVALPWWLWACGLSAREHTMWLERMARLEHIDDRSRGQSLATLGMVQVLRGDRTTADSNLDRALDLAASAQDPVTQSFITNALGLSAFFSGDSPRAEPLLRGAVEQYAELGNARADLVCTAYVHLGMLLSFDGRTDEAADCFQLVLDRCDAAGERWMRSYALFGLGLVALVEDRYVEAGELARTSLRLQEGFADSIGTPLAIELLGWAEAASGSGHRAAVLFGAASALWGAFGQHLYGSDEWQRRRAQFEERAHHELGERRFAQSRATGAAMGLAELLALADGETTDALPTPENPTEKLLAPLSPREREVALHVADGLSNRQIADLLVLSHRTIEGHVEHVLHKLNLRNRQQLAIEVTRGRHAPRGQRTRD